MDTRFPKEERLKSKKLIDLLFQEGKSIKAYPLRLMYLETQLPKVETNIQLGVSVPKRIHKKAVDRNRLKRLLRTAYRHHKKLIDTKGTTFVMLIVFLDRNMISQDEMNKAVVKLLKQFNYEISKTNPA